MKDKLNRALTNIDESLIEEAAHAARAEHRIRSTAIKIAVPAGVAAAVVGAVLIAQPYNNIQPDTSGITLNAGAQNSKPDDSDSQASSDGLFQAEIDFLQEEQEQIQEQKDNLRENLDSLKEKLDSITVKIADDKVAQSDKEILTAEEEQLREKLKNLQSEMDSVQAKQDKIADKILRLNRSKRIDGLFGDEYSEGQTAGVKADEYTISSIYFGSFFPEVLMYEEDIAVFTDGSDSILCFYDTADETPDDKRMVAQIDLQKTVELLQADPENSILPTIGDEEMCDPGIGVVAYKNGGKYELVLRVGSTDGEEKSYRNFAIDVFGSNVVFSKCDEVSGQPLERIIQSDEITPALVDGFDMYSLRLVVNKDGQSRVFDPFNKLYEYLPENYSGISIAFAQEGLRPVVYVYDTAALKEGGQWYFKGEGFYCDDYCSVSIYESGLNTAEIKFTENGDGSITITEVAETKQIVPSVGYDGDIGDFMTTESNFPAKKLEAGTDRFVPAGTAVSFEKWSTQWLELIEKAKADFPALYDINIEYRYSEYDTRLYFTAVSTEEITPEQNEDIRYWLYQNTGENHPIVEILTADSQAAITNDMS